MSVELSSAHELRATAVARRFGNVEALRGASLAARTGSITGLIGPNGAGKSTLLSCVAGLDRADSGDVTVDGQPTSLTRHRELVFFVGDGVRPWPDQRVGEVLAFFAALHGASATQRSAVAEQLQLGTVAAQRVGELSKGQGKRLALALGLLTPHPFLLLDEPFDGLDLRQVREVATVLRAHAARGRALVLSIHQLNDAVRCCDELVLLDAGRTVASGTIDELRRASGLIDGGIEEVFLALT